MLSKLAYLMLCRSIRLLARGDADKDLEILVLHHSSVCCAVTSHA